MSVIYSPTQSFLMVCHYNCPPSPFSLYFLLRSLGHWAILVVCSLAVFPSYAVLICPKEMDWKNVLLCLLHNSAVSTIVVPPCWQTFVGSFRISSPHFTVPVSNRVLHHSCCSLRFAPDSFSNLCICAMRLEAFSVLVWLTFSLFKNLFNLNRKNFVNMHRC